MEGDTQMRRTTRLLVRAILCALLVLGLGASAANADSGRCPDFPGAAWQANMLPEDPGLE